jgi:putative phage-type endonuclease
MRNKIFRPVEIDIPQGTPQWLKWRDGGLGGTDSATLMGLTQWDTVSNLWMCKTGKKAVTFTGNAATEHGKALEPVARADFERHHGIHMTPKCFEHPEYPWMRVSVDGIDDEWQTVLEIKCPYYPANHAKMKVSIPPNYYTQMQKQLAVTNAGRVIFWSYTKTGWHEHVVLPDEPFIEELIKREEIFWGHVENRTFPSSNLFPPYEYRLAA